MQYYTLLTVMAGAAAVSAGITDSLLGSSLTGTATGAADGQAKGSLSGLPTDELLGSGIAGDAAKKAPVPFGKAPAEAKAAAKAAGSADSKDALADSGLLAGLGLKQLRSPDEYLQPHTTYYQAVPTTVIRVEDPPVTTTVTAVIPTGTIINSGVVSCSNGTAASCCDTNSASDGLLSNILGGSCALSSLKIPVLAAGAIGGSQCNQGNTFCCPINQDVSLDILIAIDGSTLTYSPG